MKKFMINAGSNVLIKRKWGRRSEITVPHQGGELVIAHPFYGPNTAKGSRDSIRADGLREPTAPEAISFLVETFERDIPEGDVNQIMTNNKFVRAFTGILYHRRQKIVAFIDFPEFDEDGRINTQNLLDRLNDENTRKVSLRDIREGLKTSSQIKKDPYTVGLYGEEGAEKVARLVGKHYFYSCNLGHLVLPSHIGKEPISRIPALISMGHYVHGNSLGIIGEDDGMHGGGYAFGIIDPQKLK